VELYDSEGGHLGCILEALPLLSTDTIKVHTFTLPRADLMVPQPGVHDLVQPFN
jgi:hypothetical protein